VDAQAKMVVGHLDVGHTASSCQCLCALQDSTLVHVEENKKRLMSHYEFHHQIALAWLLSGDEPGSTGSLCMQLDDDQHFLVFSTISKRPCCSLCQWVEEEKDTKKLLKKKKLNDYFKCVLRRHSYPPGTSHYLVPGGGGGGVRIS
jgi:hypothetical protein